MVGSDCDDKEKNMECGQGQQEVAAFTVKGLSNVEKTKDIFGALDKLESQHFCNESTQTLVEKHVIPSFDDGLNPYSPYEKKRKLSSPLDLDTEQVFKMPRSPISTSKKKIKPDFLVHPQNWTCYDLSTVSTMEMSEHSNTAIALDFLKQIHESKNVSTCQSDLSVEKDTVLKEESNLKYNSEIASVKRNTELSVKIYNEDKSFIKIDHLNETDLDSSGDNELLSNTDNENVHVDINDSDKSNILLQKQSNDRSKNSIHKIKKRIRNLRTKVEED